jgi:pimeloyl-ACP methyl ester carboxylesterase
MERRWLSSVCRIPERIQAIITQNLNAYEKGLGAFWAETIIPYWQARNPRTEEKIRNLLTPEATQFQYTAGLRSIENLNPDSYIFDQMTLDRPGNQAIQLALFYDDQNNVKQYPIWHETLRRVKPPVLAVWGKNDPIFVPPGAEAFLRDLPDTEIHFFDTGHFALEEESDQIAETVVNFLARHVR